MIARMIANLNSFTSSNNSTTLLNAFTASANIRLSNLETEAFQATDNTISTYVSNANIEFRPNGTGTVESLSNTNVTGNIHATGNITTDGNIIVGDQNTDSIIINAVQVYDILGNQVISKNPSSSQAVIDASRLSSGVYIAKIGTEHGNATFRLIRK